MIVDETLRVYPAAPDLRIAGRLCPCRCSTVPQSARYLVEPWRIRSCALARDRRDEHGLVDDVGEGPVGNRLEAAGAVEAAPHETGQEAGGERVSGTDCVYDRHLAAGSPQR